MRRASSGDDASPVREKITRRSRRSKQEAIPSEESSQKPSVSTVEEAVISETEQVSEILLIKYRVGIC